MGTDPKNEITNLNGQILLQGFLLSEGRKKERKKERNAALKHLREPVEVVWAFDRDTLWTHF